MKINSEFKFIMKMLIIVVIGLMFVVYGKYIQKETRQEVIESAQFVKDCGGSYLIAFGDEVHEYNWTSDNYNCKANNYVD